MNQFLKNDHVTVLPLTEARKEDALTVLKVWQSASQQDMASNDYGPCTEALEMQGRLGLTGAIVYAAGQPAGFILGEALNRDTFTIHFAKADIRFKGVYQFLFSRFARDFCPEYIYMNLEQDMGKDGLRETKVSYRPALMAHKYRVWPRVGS